MIEPEVRRHSNGTQKDALQALGLHDEHIRKGLATEMEYIGELETYPYN